MQNLEVSLAQYKPISQYRPRIGDFIIWHGLLTHYYGVINGIDESNGTIRVIKAGMPLLLFNMEPDEMDSNTTTVKLSKIKSSRGAYAAQQVVPTGSIWYV
jgi:hypothetical protein